MKRSRILSTSSSQSRHHLVAYPHQTPARFTTTSFVNTSEERKYFDNELKDELGSSLYIDVPDFFDAFFSGVSDLAEPVWERQSCIIQAW